MESFAEIFKRDSEVRAPEPGTLIQGTVVEVRKGVVVVNAGLKSEAIVPCEQFEDEPRDGDKFEFFLDAVEDGYGRTRLSRTKARWIEAWKELEEIQAKNEIITGHLVSRIKGGFSVKVKGMMAFLPGSLIDLRSVPDTANIENTEMDFKIVKLDKNRDNIVLSRRAVLNEQNSAEREEIIKNLKKGSVVKGIVKTVTNYGAFLSVGGVDGLLHVCHMAWRHVHNPSEIVTPGEEIEVVVLDYEEDKNRLSLGLKQLTGDPWENVTRQFPQGARVFGKVTNITDYGHFVEIEEGVEGLVHMSEIDWVEKNINPGKAVSVGQEVEVVVLEVDLERRRLSLSMKQCQPNPWKEFAEKYNKGDVVEGVVKSLTDFGIFVRTNDIAIDGLVHLSDISWTESAEVAMREYEKGQAIKTVILEMDAERERISLGVKQLSEDVIGTYLKNHPEGSLITGVIDSIEDGVGIVQLAEGVRGLLNESEIPEGGVGAEFSALITGYDKKRCALKLSTEAAESAEERRVIKEYSDTEQSRTTLGDVAKD